LQLPKRTTTQKLINILGFLLTTVASGAVSAGQYWMAKCGEVPQMTQFVSSATVLMTTNEFENSTVLVSHKHGIATTIKQKDGQSSSYQISSQMAKGAAAGLCWTRRQKWQLQILVTFIEAVQDVLSVGFVRVSSEISTSFSTNFL
jgi:hypothetical protein